MGAIEDAIAAIESLEPGEKFSYRRIAATYGCSHSALSKRHQGITGLRSTVAENQQALHPQQEQELLHYIKQLTERGLLPTRAIIQRFGSDIAKRELGKGWVNRYIQRYNVYLVSRWATGMDRLRYQANSQSKYSLYFKLLRSKLSQYNIEPRYTYNIDEKGFLLGVLTRSKRIFSRRLYKERKIKAYI
jgi:hypothetical protein